MGRHSDNARETILDAAESVVIEVGAGHLTLDAVAAKAGVSKGGVLYHFPNKKCLLNAMLDRRVARLDERTREKLAGLPEKEKSPIAAHVRSLLEIDERGNKLSVALLAAVAHDPQLLVPYRQESRRCIDEFRRAGVSFETAVVIMLAADGLKFLELFSLSPFNDRERNRIIREIIALSKREK